MKQLLAILILFLSNSLHAQVISGTLVQARRMRTDSTSLNVFDKYDGVVFVDIAVDNKGVVTWASIHGEGTTIDSPTSLKKAVILAKMLTFTPGTQYDKFQHAVVRFTFVKEDNEWIQED